MIFLSRNRKWLCLAFVLCILTVLTVTANAAGDVAGAIENTWDSAKSQIKLVVNNGAATRCC